MADKAVLVEQRSLVAMKNQRVELVVKEDQVSVPKGHELQPELQDGGLGTSSRPLDFDVVLSLVTSPFLLGHQLKLAIKLLGQLIGRDVALSLAELQHPRPRML